LPAGVGSTTAAAVGQADGESPARSLHARPATPAREVGPGPRRRPPAIRRSRGEARPPWGPAGAATTGRALTRTCPRRGRAHRPLSFPRAWGRVRAADIEAMVAERIKRQNILYQRGRVLQW
jgi:hypothetical protein